MQLSAALEALHQISEHAPADATLRVSVHSPGAVGPAPACEVTNITAGFDWNSGKILIDTQEPLTRLTPEEVADIRKSVSRGQSWHAYQRYKAMKAELDEKEEERRAAQDALDGLRAEIAALQKRNDLSLLEALASLSALVGPPAPIA